MGNSRLPSLYMASRITLIAIMVLEIQLLQIENSAQYGRPDRFCYCLFLVNLTSESGKVVHMKIVENFSGFPTIWRMPLFDF